MMRIVWLLACWGLWGMPLLAQDTTDVHVVQIVHADSSVGEVREGQRIRKLLGHVRLRQEDAEVYAQQAIQYVDTRLFELAGRVVIIDQGRDTLQAPVILYSEQARRGEAEGGIRYTDGEVTVVAPKAVYDLVRKEIYFSEGVRLRDSVSTLTSRQGIYRIKPREAFFWGDVHLLQDDVHIQADTLVHQRTLGETRAHGRVALYKVRPDSSQLDVLMGHSLYYRRPEAWGRVEGRPLWVRLSREDGRLDTLLLRAQRFEIQRTDSVEKVFATGDVRLWRETLAARMDSAAYIQFVDTTRSDRLGLFRHPRGWVRRNQVVGDTIEVYLTRSHPNVMHVHQNVYVGLADSVLTRVHQAKGKQMTGFFRADTLREVVLSSNVEAIYFLKEGDSLAGAVTLSADTLRIHLTGERPERIKALRGIAGTYYEKRLIPEDLKLKGFRWMEEERPSKKELLNVPHWMNELLQRLVHILRGAS